MHKKIVRYHGRYTESQLEGLVEEGVYPPSIKCAVLYNSPRDFESHSLESFDMKIEGIAKHHVSFPIKVYNSIGESMSMRCVHRQIIFQNAQRSEAHSVAEVQFTVVLIINNSSTSCMSACVTPACPCVQWL